MVHGASRQGKEIFLEARALDAVYQAEAVERGADGVDLRFSLQENLREFLITVKKTISLRGSKTLKGYDKYLPKGMLCQIRWLIPVFLRFYLTI